MPIDADEVKEVKALMQQVSDRRDEISERMENFRDDIVDQIEQFRSELKDDVEQLGQLMAAVSRKLATMKNVVTNATAIGYVGERAEEWAEILGEAADDYDVSLLVPELSVDEWDDELDDVPAEIPEIPATIDEV